MSVCVFYIPVCLCVYADPGGEGGAGGERGDRAEEDQLSLQLLQEEVEHLSWRVGL